MICNLLDRLLGMSCMDHQSRTTIQPNSLSSKIVPLDATYVLSLCSVLLGIFMRRLSLPSISLQAETKLRHRCVEKSLIGPWRKGTRERHFFLLFSIYDNESGTLAGKILKKPRAVFHPRLSKRLVVPWKIGM